MTVTKWPKKPEGVTWTDDQWKAIVAGGSNILVAAAAGSGKTAVLVERIIRKIAAETDVDRLLVATFTKAAAAEMKERIRIALEKELDKNPGSDHLRRQLALMGRASITTLHSFCLDVIRRYYSLIGLDPGFRIASETEAELLRIDILDGLFEELYAMAEAERESGTRGASSRNAGETGFGNSADAEAAAGLDDEVAAEQAADIDDIKETGRIDVARFAAGGFLELVDRFGGERGDEPLYRLVLRLYNFSQSHPWPAFWLRSTAASFDVADAADLGRTGWVDTIKQQVALALDGAVSLLEQALELTRRPDGPAAYAATFEEDLALVRSLAGHVRKEPWEAWSGTFAEAGFGKLKSMRGDDFDKALQEQAKELREMAKTAVTDLKEELFVRSPEEFAAELQELAPLMRTLAELVIAFGARFEAAKREKGLLDFGDMEHYCLRILRDPASTPEVTLPSAAALEYRRQFDEILLDEYQDTNMVQEAIVSLIARPGAGNRFMVGDVKQSIYRFRLAEPNLFMRKYKTYTAADAGLAEESAASAEAALRASEGGAALSAAESRASEGSAAESPVSEGGTLLAAAELHPSGIGGDAGVSGAAHPVGLGVAAGGERGGGSTALVPITDGGETGLRIDLARNFRSRQEVVDGVNGIFRAIMRERVAEMDYDERAELICGASYPPSGEGGPPERYSIEFAVLDKGASIEAASSESVPEDDGGDPADASAAREPAEDLQAVRLEARWIASQIVRLRGADGIYGTGLQPFEVYDGKRGRKRTLAWRDIVILLRADKMWAPVIIEELQAHGIPAYAELSSGYFEATEVETILSLLRVIDNPYQDIPLAGALRSPIFGMTAEELALVRIAAQHASYFDAVKHAASEPALPEGTRRKLSAFLTSLDAWREEAKQGSVAELLWRLYRETGYYDLAGGMPGGLQRQANLRALHDRARQYESSSLRGLFRFLRFIDRMRENGGDLGTARALGEQEDVVRIMSIHKSKGLEFPVVFIAGLGKSFNKQDLNSPFLMHKELGFGPRFIDAGLRVSYPTLPYLAVRERLRMESLAEEMRILYVALTRPKEKMFLVGTVANAEKELQRWQSSLGPDGRLPDFRLAQAKRFLDWIAPLALREGIPVDTFLTARREEDGGEQQTAGSSETEPAGMMGSESASIVEEMKPDWAESLPGWKTGIVSAAALASIAEAAPAAEANERAANAFAERLQAVRALVPLPASGELADELDRRFTWRYPHQEATEVAAKTSVTEMKRMYAEADEAAAVLPLPSGALEGEEGNDAGLARTVGRAEEGEAVLPISSGVPGCEKDSAEDDHSREIGRADGKIEQLSFDFFAEVRYETVGAEIDQPASRPAPSARTDNVVRGGAGKGEFTFRLRRPKFMEETSLTAAERGTVSHLVMQHIPLSAGAVDESVVRETIGRLLERRMLAAQQADAVDASAVAEFFDEPVGRRLLKAEWVRRESPFSCMLPAGRVYPASGEALDGEPILIQGVIDCLFRDEGGLVLLDYKTDRIVMKRWEEAAERHRFQLSLYAEAIGRILGRPVDECYVFFFDGGKTVRLF